MHQTIYLRPEISKVVFLWFSALLHDHTSQSTPITNTNYPDKQRYTYYYLHTTYTYYLFG